MQLSYVSVVSSDIDRLRDFYVDALGLTELEEWSHDGFRAVAIGPDLVLALHSPGAYGDLGLPLPPDGHAPLLTFDPGDAQQLRRLHEQLVAKDVPTVREPFETPYGSLQVIHRDVDGNPFRLNTFNL